MNRAHAKAIADLKVGEVFTGMKMMLHGCKVRECTLRCVRTITDDLHAFLVSAKQQGMYSQHPVFFQPLDSALADLKIAMCFEKAEVECLAKAFVTISAANQRIFSN